MPPYPNYYSQNMYNQPYYPNFQQNQSYGMQNQYQGMQNTLNGKTVTDFNTISASDVPMDGSVAVFIKNDLSEIQTRQWTPNGNIKSVSYTQMVNVSPTEEKSKFESKLDEQSAIFDEIKERLQNIEKVLTRKSRKEVDQDA